MGSTRLQNKRQQVRQPFAPRRRIELEQRPLQRTPQASLFRATLSSSGTHGGLLVAHRFSNTMRQRESILGEPVCRLRYTRIALRRQQLRILKNIIRPVVQKVLAEN